MTSETPKLSIFQLRHRQGQQVTRPAVSFRGGSKAGPGKQRKSSLRLPLTRALKGLFLRVQTCVLVDVSQPLPWFFTRWPRADSFTVFRALGRKCLRLSCFCNILLQDPAQLHVKITRSTNLLSVCRRKLKLSPYTHCKLQPHNISQCTFATRSF